MPVVTAKPKVRLARAAWAMLAVTFRADPWRAAVTFVLTIVSALSDALVAYWMKVLVEGVVARDFGRVLFSASGMGVTVAFSALTGISGFLLQIGLSERAGLRIDRDIIEMTAGLPGLEHHERPEYLDELEMLRAQRESITSTVSALVQNAGAVSRLTGSALLLAHVHPMMLALPLFGLPTLAASAYVQKLIIRVEERIAEPRRRTRHLFDLTTTAAPAKELRIFGLGDELVRRHEEILHTNDRIALRARLRGTVWASAAWLLFSLAYVGVILFAVHRAITRPTPGALGDVVLVLTIGGQINWQVNGVAGLIGWLMNNLKVASRYVWLRDYAKTHRARAADAPVPNRIESGIDVTGVTFRYPGTETDVLRDVTLHIPAGSTVAIVGDNGAGKTTLVKLLCRFYEPTDGAITLDGIDIARFDIEQWRARMSAGFQDFARFELLAREVVGVGDVVRIEDEPAVVGALARARALDVLEPLPNGLETQLGKSFDNGHELSGGQWQKLALGRAMMREAPLLLVLDEPTAALDAQTEHALFERYAGAAERAAESTGAITLFVSHRFSTVRMADLIAVVDGGRVVEFGSHGELMANGGLYAELYELQARAYR